MNEITEKLYQDMMAEFYPVAKELAAAGNDQDTIVNTFIKQLNLKVKQYYDNQKKPSVLENIFKAIPTAKEKEKADSKAEIIFYQMLRQNNIQFKFQYPIGPYRADYLVDGFLVIELDGPHHQNKHDKRRDAYLNKLGYEVLRIGLVGMAWNPEKALELINKAISLKRASRKNRRS